MHIGGECSQRFGHRVQRGGRRGLLGATQQRLDALGGRTDGIAMRPLGSAHVARFPGEQFAVLGAQRFGRGD